MGCVCTADWLFAEWNTAGVIQRHVSQLMQDESTKMLPGTLSGRRSREQVMVLRNGDVVNCFEVASLGMSGIEERKASCCIIEKLIEKASYKNGEEGVYKNKKLS